MKRIIIIIISCILTINGSDFVLSAQSGRITKQSSIRAVTVFPGRAMVTRELKTDVTPGRYTLAFSHLPLSLVDRSVRVTGKGTAAAKILDVQVKQEILTKPTTVKLEPLKNRQAAITKELNALADRMNALDKKEKFLERLMNNTLEAIAKNKNPQPVSLPEYKKMLDFLEERLNELFDSKREITENQAKLNREQEVIVKKLRWNPNADAKEVKTVLIDLEVKNLPKLAPIYLDIVSFEKGLIAGVVISMDGSPMPGVTVRVSGNRIDERTAITDEEGRFQFTNLPSGSFNVRASLNGFKTCLRKDIQVFNGKISKLDIALETASIKEEITISGKVSTVVRSSSTSVSVSKDLIKTLTETTEVSQGMLSTYFTLKHLDTVNSSRDASKVTAAIARVPVKKEHIALPLHAEHVFLRVKVKNSSDTPLLAGPINLFFDGNFVNTARLGYKNPDQSFELPLGIDKAIEVERTLLEKESTIKGFFNLAVGVKTR